MEMSIGIQVYSELWIFFKLFHVQNSGNMARDCKNLHGGKIFSLLGLNLLLPKRVCFSSERKFSVMGGLRMSFRHWRISKNRFIIILLSLKLGRNGLGGPFKYLFYHSDLNRLKNGTNSSRQASQKILSLTSLLRVIDSRNNSLGPPLPLLGYLIPP